MKKFFSKDRQMQTTLPDPMDVLTTGASKPPKVKHRNKAAHDHAKKKRTNKIKKQSRKNNR